MVLSVELQLDLQKNQQEWFHIVIYTQGMDTLL